MEEEKKSSQIIEEIQTAKEAILGLKTRIQKHLIARLVPVSDSKETEVEEEKEDTSNLCPVASDIREIIKDIVVTESIVVAIIEDLRI